MSVYGVIDYLRLKQRQREALEEASTLYDSAEAKGLVTVLKEVRDRLPASLTASGNLRVALVEDTVGLATEATLSGLRTTVDTYLPNLDIAVSALRDSLKPSRGTVTQALSAQSVAAGASTSFDVSGQDGWSAIVLAVRVTYGAAATTGSARVRWLYSPDGTNYDSPEDAEAEGNYVDLTFAAGATRQRTILIPLLAPYVRVEIVNNTDDALTVDAWWWPLR